MKRINLSQTDDREAWLDERRSKITGTKFAKVRPLKVKKNGTNTPSGFWDLLAEFIALSPDGQKPMDRGHDLENVAIAEAIEKLGIDANTVEMDAGMWVSDDDDHIAYSPDGAEKSDKVTFAFECKCLGSGKHVMHIIRDIVAKNAGNDEYMAKLPDWLIDALPPISEEYNPLLSVPAEYQEQCTQAFVANSDLQKLYFVMYDDRMSIDDYVCHIVTINRSDIEDSINNQMTVCKQQLAKIRELLGVIVNNGL